MTVLLPPSPRPVLYHYTCAHFAATIGRDGYLFPHPQPVLGGALLTWLTDLEEPDALALGLESTTLGCNRTDACYVVNTRWLPEGAVQWWPRARRHFAAGDVAALEDEGRQPSHWWVASMPIPVRRKAAA